jgi:hypothetical protein
VRLLREHSSGVCIFPGVISLDSEDGHAACTVEVRGCCFAPVA